jgi:hypothetical protein
VLCCHRADVLQNSDGAEDVYRPSCANLPEGVGRKADLSPEFIIGFDEGIHVIEGGAGGSGRVHLVSADGLE